MTNSIINNLGKKTNWYVITGGPRRFLNLPEDEKLTEALRNVSYKKVFILDCLPLMKLFDEYKENEVTYSPNTIVKSQPWGTREFPA